MCRERPDQRLNVFDGRNGCDIAKASEDMPLSTCFHVIGAAIGDPSPTRGEQAPTAVVPRRLRK
jgi:hypothetical protein